MKLRSHRKHVVRPAARAAQLAYGFLRGKPYRKIEPNFKIPTGPWEKSLWKTDCVDEVVRLANKFGPPNSNFKEEVERWFDI